MAIAFDAASSVAETLTASSLSWDHTCTGSDGELQVFVGSQDDTLADRTVSSITYNGVALTLAKAQDAGGARRIESWILPGPATGTHTIAVTMGGTCDVLIGGAVSLTGARQNGQPNTTNGGSGSGTSSSVSLTTVTDNCWIVDALMTVTASSVTPGGSQTQRVAVAGVEVDFFISTQGPKTPAGSVASTWSWTGTSPYLTNGIAIAPPSEIKTINGLELASVKTIDGLAAGSVRKWNGLS